MIKTKQAFLTEAKGAFRKELARQFGQYCDRNMGRVDFDPYTWQAEIDLLECAVLDDDNVYPLMQKMTAMLAEDMMDDIRDEYLEEA